MRLLIIFFYIFEVFAFRVTAAEVNPLLLKPKTSWQAGEQAIKLMNLMTAGERFDLVCGKGFGTAGVPRLGIPELKFGDASCGLRVDFDDPVKSTAFPCSLLLAATWEPTVARQYGEAVAEEFRMAGRHFILGPGMNIYRSALNGRNFEYLGEDPYRAARMVEAYVGGANKVNVGTTLKHYLCNDTENYRRATDSRVEERAIHEIYLPPFEAGVNAGTWGVMTSYNLVNGEWASQNRFLVTELLRKNLGYNNLIMTDWDSTWYGDKLIKSGVDLEMPDGFSLKRDRNKVIGTPDIDRMVTNILKTGIVSGLYELEAKGEFKKPEWSEKLPTHDLLARQVNEAGIVLLKNNGLLPLQKGTEDKILVTGNLADMDQLAGGGSGHVIGWKGKNYLQAVQEIFGKNHVTYSQNPDDDQIRTADKVLIFTGWNGSECDGRNHPYHHADYMWIGLECEGRNHPFKLPEDALIAHCVELNPKTVVTLSCVGGVAMTWADKAAGIFLAMYGGEAGPDALMELMTGKVNPSGKLPFSIERRLEDSLVFGDDAGIHPGKILADSKDLVARLENYKGEFLLNADKTEAYTRDLDYKEGIFVGYRWYDMKNIEPRFPFGYGLSYTTFGYSDLKVEKKGDEGVVRLTVKNTGKVEGAEVVQIYVGEPKASVKRPVRELKGFKKVFLEPGESKVVEVALKSRAFAFWDVASHGWKVDPGEFVIEAGSSSCDIKERKILTF